MPSRLAVTAEMFRVLRGSSNLETRPDIEAISHAPRIAYPHFGPEQWSYFAISEARVLSMCTLTLELFRML